MRNENAKIQLNCEISEQLHRQIKAAAAIDGLLLKEWVTTALEKMAANGYVHHRNGYGNLFKIKL